MDNNQFSVEELVHLRNIIRSYQNMLKLFCHVPAFDNHNKIIDNLYHRITNLLTKTSVLIKVE